MFRLYDVSFLVSWAQLCISALLGGSFCFLSASGGGALLSMRLIVNRSIVDQS